MPSTRPTIMSFDQKPAVIRTFSIVITFFNVLPPNTFDFLRKDFKPLVELKHERINSTFPSILLRFADTDGQITWKLLLHW